MRVLLIDTCGEVGLVALADGPEMMREVKLPAREASRTLLDAIAKLLEMSGWSFGELNAVAVVAGPGSFTGVRVGMAAAKGLCEATGVRLVSISRLAMLANGASAVACAVLDAGRGEFYVRTPDGRESLARLEQLSAVVNGSPVVVCEQKTFDVLQAFGPERIEMSLRLALPLVLHELDGEGRDAALADANYVRREQDIYAKGAA